MANQYRPPEYTFDVKPPKGGTFNVATGEVSDEKGKSTFLEGDHKKGFKPGTNTSSPKGKPDDAEARRRKRKHDAEVRAWAVRRHTGRR